jgi:ABC-type nitrate/sulfonate/bicarbonate transport system substrate-binding protein
MKKIFLGLALAALLSACAKKEEAAPATAERVLRLAYIGSSSSQSPSAINIALGKGFLEERLKPLNVKLDVQGFVGGPPLNEVIAAAGLDIANYGDLPIIAAKSNGLNTTLLGIDTYVNDAILVVRSASPYRTLADLKNQKVAVPTNTYIHRTLIKMLEGDGLDESYIQLTNMSNTDAGAAILGGDVEATIGSLTSYLKPVQSGDLRILLDCAGNPEWKGSTGYVLIGDYGKKNPDIVDAFLQSIFDSLDFIKNNPEDTKIAYSQRGPLSVEDLTYLYPRGFPFNISLDEESIAAVEDIRDFMVDKELILNRFSIRDWSDPGYLQAVRAKR